MMITFETATASALVSLLVTLLTVFMLLGKYKQKVDANGSEIEKTSKKLSELAERIAKIEGGLERDRALSGLVQSRTPLTLTEKGSRVLNESGGKAYIDQHKILFINTIKEKAPKSAYDVQEQCRICLEAKKDDDDFISIKDYAFQKGLPLEHIIMALSIYLRDFALNELGFKVDESTTSSNNNAST